MKTLFQILCIIFFSLSVSAQSTTPPDPPAPPSSSSNSSSSVSTSKSDNSLRFKAKWSNKSRYNILKNYLLDQLGEDGLTVSGNTYKWSKESNAFNCKLTSKTMNLFLDYNEASKSLKEQVDDMMDNLKYAAGNGKPEDKVKRAQKEIEKYELKYRKAVIEIERAKKELERAKRELERKQKSKNFEEQREVLEKRREEAIKERKIIKKEILEERKKIRKDRKEIIEKRKEKEKSN